MQNRIIEVSSDNVHLSLFRGFAKFSKDGAEIGRVPLPDVGGLIVRGYGASISLNLVARLAEENIPVVLCGADQSPASIVWPVGGHHEQGHIVEAQGALSLPQRKRLWQALIRAKIQAQGQALEHFGEHASDLLKMAQRVKSGDVDNVEAQAARKYWPRMMGAIEESFRRSRQEAGLNAWLNYGYTVLRAGAARSVLAAGLHPSLSIKHSSRGEAFRLTSDIMEPFRPWVDLTVRQIAEKEPGNVSELNPEHKRQIVRVLSIDLQGPHGASPL